MDILWAASERVKACRQAKLEKDSGLLFLQANCSLRQINSLALFGVVWPFAFPFLREHRQLLLSPDSSPTRALQLFNGFSSAHAHTQNSGGSSNFSQSITTMRQVSHQ